MRYTVCAGVVVVVLAALVLLTTPQTTDELHDAVTAVGCDGVLITAPTASTRALHVSASNCFDVPAAVAPKIPLAGDLAAMSKAAWAGRGAFDTLSLTVYRGLDKGRPPRSVVLSAAQLESWFGPRSVDLDPVVDRPRKVAEGLLWVFLPLAGLAACVLLTGAARSGRMVVMWIVR